MELDTGRIDEAVPALLYLGLHDGARPQGVRQGAMDRLYRRGTSTEPPRRLVRRDAS
jgi:hypothetical protein